MIKINCNGKYKQTSYGLITDFALFVTQRKSIRSISVILSLSVVWKTPYFGLPKYPILQHQNTLYCNTKTHCIARPIQGVLLSHSIVLYLESKLFIRFCTIHVQYFLVNSCWCFLKTQWTKSKRTSAEDAKSIIAENTEN